MGNTRKILMGASALAGALTITLFATQAGAQTRAIAFDLPAQPLGESLRDFFRASGQQIVFSETLVAGRTSTALKGDYTPDQALAMLLEGTNLTTRRSATGVVMIEAPQSGSAAGDGADQGTVAALIVTAQKREENIQDVPIAISAFTQKDLEAQKIEGGFDLLKAIPNVTFSKNNFTGYNFQIRGIGTKAISVATDPGVAVSFNSTSLIRNRLFEQEYFDIERVEVLRGPQGTLYGRNATAGVVNVISAKPDLNDFSGMLKGEVGNYNAKRLSATVNVPLVQDRLAIRIAGAATVRDGYGVNLYDNSSVDGRDLWSLRTTVGFEPTENFRANLIWERFEEDDDRARTGKQLCTRDPGPESVGSTVLTGQYQRAVFTQGCLPGSLYDDAAFGTPNGSALPFVWFAQNFSINTTDVIDHNTDPYGNAVQSRDLRLLYSQLKSVYAAKADIIQLNAEWDVSDGISVISQTAYNKDKIYSSQDFNRFTSLPVWMDTSLASADSPYRGLTPGHIFCDPQLGCSDTIVGKDISRARSQQFSQEFRLQSDLSGVVNFSLGANYTRYRTVEDYYVFFNGITVSAVIVNTMFGTHPSKYTTDPDCAAVGDANFGPTFPDGFVCVPIEQNGLSNIEDIGHNYFLSRNPYTLVSGAVFGELYWKVTERLKLTGGIRYTDDRKRFTPIPSQLLLTEAERIESFRPALGGAVDLIKGLPLFSFASGFYPELPQIKNDWQEMTGRLVLDWQPQVPFTDETLIYGSVSRGYKAGGMNPPRTGIDYEAAKAAGFNLAPSAPPTFRPEFVNAFEAGAKNTLMGGAMILNIGAFFYDYTDYQVSKIVDRSANNENFDAEVWGLELTSIFRPNRNFSLNGSIGYLDTALSGGSKSIDIMNRTAGHADWIIAKPAVTLTSNCIVPIAVAEDILSGWAPFAVSWACPGGSVLGNNFTGVPPFGMTLPSGATYDPRDYPEANFGAGFDTDVSGKELPNSPHWTVTLGGQYSWDFLEGWRATVRSDFYWQSQQWARIYQLPIDKIHAWKNANLSLLIERPDDGLAFELYAKNIFDDTPITDTFTNSDDTALTTNIFVLDPRLIGLSIKKGF